MLTVTVVTLHWGIIKLSAKCSLWLIWAEAGITTWQFAAWCHGWQAAAGELHLSCCWSVGRGNRKIVTSMCWQPRPAPCCQLRSLSVWAELACGEWTPVPHPTIHWPLLGRRDGVYSTYYKCSSGNIVKTVGPTVLDCGYTDWLNVWKSLETKSWILGIGNWWVCLSSPVIDWSAK